MLPKKQPPLVRAETVCCVIAAILAAFCLMDHPASRWLLAAILALLIAANVIQIVRDSRDRKARKERENQK